VCGATNEEGEAAVIQRYQHPERERKRERGRENG